MSTAVASCDDHMTTGEHRNYDDCNHCDSEGSKEEREGYMPPVVS